MNFKDFSKALSAEKSRRISLTKGIAKSYITIFLVIILAVTSTFAWFSAHMAAQLHTGSGGLEFQSASSLRINKDDSHSNVISIPQFTLDEASSVDGKNIFFPVGESFTSNTQDMVFREGNAGDRNVHYVYKDFNLKGSSGSTDVYIKSYKITIKNADGTESPDVNYLGETLSGDNRVNGTYQDELVINHNASGVPQSQYIPPDDCPIRLAFIADSAYNSRVIDPSAQIKDYAENSNAVEIIDDKGVPTLKQTNNDSFASYYYGNTPLFNILPDQNLDVTLVIWLEGTMAKSANFIGKKISVDIDIESNFAEMEEISFVDDTVGDTNANVKHWVNNDGAFVACSYQDPFSEEVHKRWKTVIMTKSEDFATDYTWKASIPKKAVEHISFYRLSWPKKRYGKNADDSSCAVDPHGTILNAWYTSPDVENMLTGTSIPSGWFTRVETDGQGNTHRLETTRQKIDTDGNKYNALTYTALHGNNNATTSDSAKRLAPGVGYWDYSSGSVSPTESSTQAPTQAPSGKRQVEVNFATSQHTYVQNNYSYNGIYPYLVLSDGSEYKFNNPSINSFKWSGQLDVGVQVSRVITKNSYTGATVETFSPSSGKAIVSGSGIQYVNCYINNDKNLIFS